MSSTSLAPRRVGPSTASPVPGLDLYWIPLGAGAHVVRLSGRTYEAIAARIERRPRCPLFHSALVATTDDGPVVIEMTPIPASGDPGERGVVAEGPVGLRLAGRFRIFRYEIRCWTEGVIPDLAAAIGSPVHLTSDAGTVAAVLDRVRLVPTPVWGRDELRAGEGWNSNSVVSWLLAHEGLDAVAGSPPDGGRAPGWAAGIVVAGRDRDVRPADGPFLP